MEYIKNLFLIVGLMIFNFSGAIEYLYPVAFSPLHSCVLLIQQKVRGNINLLFWDGKNNVTQQGLWSLFNPASIQLLPDQTGFSFVDNGRLKVKHFNKRSPKTIEFDQLFQTIGFVNWIDSEQFYCSAKVSDYFSIFHCTIHGDSDYLVTQDKTDCLYPQKVSTDLFYIERSNINKHYCIKKTSYIIPEQTSSGVFNKQAIISNQSTLLVDCSDRPIIFLRMISSQEGFFIEYSRTIKAIDGVGVFKFHRLLKQNEVWNSFLLFNFSLPTQLLFHTNELSLYESLLPLIPRLIDKKIFFVDCANNNSNDLESYYYDMENETIVKSSIIKNNYFVPIEYKNSLISGGMIREAKDIIFGF